MTIPVEGAGPATKSLQGGLQKRWVSRNASIGGQRSQQWVDAVEKVVVHR
jgi:hypothetical protein